MAADARTAAQRALAALRALDLFHDTKTPEHIRERTVCGGLVSLTCLAVICVSAGAELPIVSSMLRSTAFSAFTSGERRSLLHINIDVLFPSLPCGDIVIDVSDASGLESVHFGDSLSKLRLDARGEPVGVAPVHGGFKARLGASLRLRAAAEAVGRALANASRVHACGSCPPADAPACPTDWRPRGESACEAPRWYFGPCPGTIRFAAREPDARSEVSAACEVHWPCAEAPARPPAGAPPNASAEHGARAAARGAAPRGGGADGGARSRPARLLDSIANVRRALPAHDVAAAGSGSEPGGAEPGADATPAALEGLVRGVRELERAERAHGGGAGAGAAGAAGPEGGGGGAWRGAEAVALAERALAASRGGGGPGSVEVRAALDELEAHARAALGSHAECWREALHGVRALLEGALLEVGAVLAEGRGAGVEEGARAQLRGAKDALQRLVEHASLNGPLASALAHGRADSARELEGRLEASARAVAGSLAALLGAELGGEGAEGCNVYGVLEVAFTPGRLSITPGTPPAHAAAHGRSLAGGPVGHRLHSARGRWANTSHRVRHLSFGAYFPGQHAPLERAHFHADAPAEVVYAVHVVPVEYEGVHAPGELASSNVYAGTRHVHRLRWDSAAERMPGVYLLYDISPLKLVIREAWAHGVHELAWRVLSIGSNLYIVGAVVDRALRGAARALRRGRAAASRWEAMTRLPPSRRGSHHSDSAEMGR